MKKHYRLCQRCSHVNCSDNTVEQCEQCKKFFVPYFFCDDLAQFFHSDHTTELVIDSEKSKPIIGISFVWREDSA